MNPFNVDTKSLKESKKITSEKDLLKVGLISYFSRITAKMETSEVLQMTGLDKSDLSRMRCLNLERFTIDRLIGILNSVGYTAKFTVVPTKKAS